MKFQSLYPLLLKACFLLLFIAATSPYVQAQEQTDSSGFKAIGIDFTFINNFIPLENQIGRQSGYDIYYIKSTPNNRFMRHAIDFDFRHNKSEETDTQPRTTNRYRLGYKFGVGKSKSLSDKLRIAYGWDFLGSYSYSSAKSTVSATVNHPEFDRVSKSNTYFFGTGPFCALSYNITKKLSLYTEMGYRLQFLRQNEMSFNTLDDDNEQEVKQTLISDVFSYPSTLVLFYQF